MLLCVCQEGYLFLYKAMESLCNDEETCVAGDRDSGIANCNNYSVGTHPAPLPPASPQVEPPASPKLPAEDASSQPASPKASPSATPQTADVPPPLKRSSGEPSIPAPELTLA